MHVGKSFVLRDNAGAAVGCLTSGMNALHLSFRGGKESDEIALLTEDGTWKKRRIGQQADSGGWLLEMCGASGVLLLRDGKIVADSGAEARERFEKAKRNAVREKQAKAAPEPAVVNPERTVLRENDVRSGLPERRWPPPACLEAAVYRKGKWTIEDE